jgi:cytochrome b subunit of formate dehydrogenase
MSLSMFILLITAFFPLIGIRFPWVTIHWAAGIALIVMVAWHIWHATLRQDFWSMWVGPKEIAELFGQLKKIVARSPDISERGGKYPIDHKMYHHGIVVVGFAAIITGILMMVRVDTPFWTRNPYLLGDATWGVVYVVHGASGVALITMIMVHIYFAIRPEKWWLTRSMIKGWITRTEFVSHFDSEEWDVKADAPIGVPVEDADAPVGVASSDRPTP